LAEFAFHDINKLFDLGFYPQQSQSAPFPAPREPRSAPDLASHHGTWPFLGQSPFVNSGKSTATCWIFSSV